MKQITDDIITARITYKITKGRNIAKTN